MTQNPTSCDPSTTAVEAAKVMASQDVGSVPVVKGGRLVGIVAQADVARQGDDSETGQVVEETSRQS